MNALSQVENVRKRTAVLLVAIAAMFALTVALAAPAQAHGDTVPASVTDESLEAGGTKQGAQQYCEDTFLEAVTLRADTSTNSTALGTIPAEHRVTTDCDAIPGGYYKACGVDSNLWIYVNWNNTWGYAAVSCLS